MSFDKKNSAMWIIFINIVAINMFFVGHILQTWPYIGHDYTYFVPRLLDTHLFLAKNGLTIQWYTPSFGGGLPAYPNPQHIQFSLVQFLLFISDPVYAIIISTIIYMGIGFLGCYLLFRRVFGLNAMVSIIGSVFFSANGFILNRVAVGHLGYQTFPLLAVMLWLLLDKSIKKHLASMTFGIIIAIIIHQAGFYLLISAGLSILITITLGYIYKPIAINLPRAIFISLFGGLIAILLSGSKLVAIYSFMRFFPRTISTEYESSMLFGLVGIFIQLLGTMNLVPLSQLVGLNPENLPAVMTGLSGALYGYWEFDMSMSPVVFLILILGTYRFINKFKREPLRFLTQSRWIAYLLLFAFIWVTVEFVLGNGIVYPFLQSLPILSSLHVRVRFTSAFILPCAIVATFLYNSWHQNQPKKNKPTLFIITNIFTVLPLVTYLVFPIYDFQFRNFNIKQANQIYQDIQNNRTQPITIISEIYDDSLALRYGISSLMPYEPIFGYDLDNFLPEIMPGPILQEQNGFYNMTNPSGYVFPLENNASAFERIRIDDRANLESFLKHENVTWNMPYYQIALNWISGITLLLLILVLVLTLSRDAPMVVK